MLCPVTFIAHLCDWRLLSGLRSLCLNNFLFRYDWLLFTFKILFLIVQRWWSCAISWLLAFIALLGWAIELKDIAGNTWWFSILLPRYLGAFDSRLLGASNLAILTPSLLLAASASSLPPALLGSIIPIGGTIPTSAYRSFLQGVVVFSANFRRLSWKLFMNFWWWSFQQLWWWNRLLLFFRNFVCWLLALVSYGGILSWIVWSGVDKSFSEIIFGFGAYLDFQISSIVRVRCEFWLTLCHFLRYLKLWNAFLECKPLLVHNS